MKSVVCKNRQIEQSTKAKTTQTVHLIYSEGGIVVQWVKDSLLNKWFWENWISTQKKILISV